MYDIVVFMKGWSRMILETDRELDQLLMVKSNSLFIKSPTVRPNTYQLTVVRSTSP